MNMANNLAILFTSAALLCCMHLVASMPTYNEFTIRERAQMLQSLITDYTEFMIEGLQQNKATIQSVLNDPEVKNNDELRFTVMFIKDIVSNVDNHKNIPKSMYMQIYPMIKSSDFNELRDFITKYNTATTGYVTNKDQLFRAALQRNGIHDGDMIKGLTQNFKEHTTPKLESTIKRYIDSLSVTEKINQADIVEFLREFQNENDNLEKLNKFETFLDTEKNNLLSTRGQFG